MSLVDSIKSICLDVVRNLSELKLDRLTSRTQRGNLTLSNGIASLKLKGAEVYINDIPSSDIGSGSGSSASTTTDVMAGTGIWGEPTPKNFTFARSEWGSYAGLYLPTSTGVPAFGLYVHQINASDCTFVTTDKILPAGTFVRRMIDNDDEPKLYSGSSLILTADGDQGAAYSLDVLDVSAQGVAWLKLYRDADVVVDDYFSAGDTLVYERSVDGITFPIVAVYIKEAFRGTEATAVEFGGIWKVDDAWQANVSYNEAGVYLYEASNVDMQRKRLQFGDQSYIEDTTDDSGNLRISGDINVKIGTSSGDAFTEALRVTNDGISPKVPVDMSTFAITTSKDSFAANELVDKEYVDAAITTNAHTTEEIQDIVGAMAHAGTGMSVYYDDALGRFTYTCTATGTGVTDHGSLTGLADDDHTQYYNSTRLNAVLADFLPLTGGTVTGSTTFNSGIISKGVTYLQDTGGNTKIKVDGNGVGFPYGFVFGTDIDNATEGISTYNGMMNFSSSNGFKFNDDVDMNSNKITGLPTTSYPSNNGDAVTKKYTDDNFLKKTSGQYEAYGPIDLNGNYLYLYGTSNCIWSTTDGYTGIAGGTDVTLYGGAVGNLCVDSTGVKVFNKLYIGNTDTYIYRDTSGNLVFHVAKDKGVKFEEASA